MENTGAQYYPLGGVDGYCGNRGKYSMTRRGGKGLKEGKKKGGNTGDPLLMNNRVAVVRHRNGH